MNSQKFPKVSIIILGYNSKKYLKNCFDFLYNQSYKNFEVIYIDNNSNDGSYEFVKNNYNFGNLKIIKNKNNLGYTGGNNVGIKISRCEYVMCLNPDVLLHENFLQNIVKEMEANKDIGAATGKILKFKFANNKIRKTKVIDSLGLKIFKNHRVVEFMGGEKDSKKLNIGREVFGVSGAAPVFRKEALQDIKFGKKHIQYFDEEFFSYKEDVDISFRLRHAGWKCYYAADAVCYHDRWETGSEKENRKMISKRKKKSEFVNFYSYRNHLLFIIKNEYFANILICFPSILWYELKKFVYLLVYERKTLKGLLDIIKLLPLTIRNRHDILNKSKIRPSEIRRWFYL